MESIQPQLEDFASNIDDLEAALQPIITTALSATTSKLPLLDKAKLCVLATYALESILFSFLRLNGIEAKSHPVYTELSRVKDYFAKIKTAEELGAGGAQKARLDKDAAGRFIKAGLAGNERYDRNRRERQDSERAGAKRKLEEMGVGTHTRFNGSAKRIKEAEQVLVVRASDVEEEDEDEEADDTDEQLDDVQEEEKDPKRKKQLRREFQAPGKASKGGDESTEGEPAGSKKRKKAHDKRGKRIKKLEKSLAE